MKIGTPIQNGGWALTGNLAHRKLDNERWHKTVRTTENPRRIWMSAILLSAVFSAARTETVGDIPWAGSERFGGSVAGPAEQVNSAGRRAHFSFPRVGGGQKRSTGETAPIFGRCSTIVRGYPESFLGD